MKPTRNLVDASHVQRLVVEVRGLKQELFCSTQSLRQSNGQSLGQTPPELWFLKVPGSTGRAEKGTSFPAEYLKQKAAVLTWNPPGYGQSEGAANLQLAADLLPDVVEAVVQGLGWSKIPLFAMGTSLGGALCVHLCTQRDVAGIVLCNPPSLPELMPRYNRWWNLWMGGNFVASSIPPALRTITVASQVKTPALLVTSLADTVVPPALQRRIADHYAGPLKVLEIPDAGHGLRMAEIPELKMRPALQWLLAQAGLP